MNDFDTKDEVNNFELHFKLRSNLSFNHDNPSRATVQPSQLGHETDIDGEITTYENNQNQNDLIKIVQNSDSFANIS